MDLDRILKVAVRGGASDVLLKTGGVPRFRFNGELVALSDGQEVSTEIMQGWIDKILPPRLLGRLEQAGDADFSYQAPNGSRFRVNLFRQRQTYGMVMRVVSTHIRTLEELQLPAVLRRLSDERRGLLLVTGATGSGKSTTLAAMLQRINIERAAHIITIEDPIEFSFKDHRATVNQREIGIDSESFGSALRAALRQNPDVILVGELRDQETIETALMAAQTGHLVMSTLHTIDAVETLTRIMSYFPPHQHASLREMLASTLVAVVSQRLVVRADGKGQVAANEIMVSNGNVRDMIIKADSFTGLHNIIAAGESYGMQSFDAALIALYQAGVISRDQAIAQASSKDNMKLTMRGVGT